MFRRHPVQAGAGLAGALDLAVVLVAPRVLDRLVRPLLARAGDVGRDGPGLLDGVRPVLGPYLGAAPLVPPPGDVTDGVHPRCAVGAAAVVAVQAAVDAEPGGGEPLVVRDGADADHDGRGGQDATAREADRQAAGHLVDRLDPR